MTEPTWDDYREALGQFLYIDEEQRLLKICRLLAVGDELNKKLEAIKKVVEHMNKVSPSVCPQEINDGIDSLREIIGASENVRN